MRRTIVRSTVCRKGKGTITGIKMPSSTAHRATRTVSTSACKGNACYSTKSRILELNTCTVYLSGQYASRRNKVIHGGLNHSQNVTLHAVE
ncbi:unnamed protein product, partial [Nesidiocoris tenuis]